MTENTTTEQLASVVPAGCDPLDDLTAGELGHIGRLLRCDPENAVRGGTGKEGDPANGQRWPALAHVAWVWKRRTDPKAKLDEFLQLKPAQISTLLGFDLDLDDEPAPAEQEADENPTDSTPASS